MQQPTYRRIEVRDVCFFCREAGQVGRPQVLLLHGSPSSSFQFRYLIGELSDDFHILAPDLPGFGLTEVRQGAEFALTFDGLAQTLSRLLRRLAFQPAVVYLHDYGAQTGFRLLANGVISPTAIIVQNSECYHGTGWRDMMWAVEKRGREEPKAARARLREALLSRSGIEREFYEDLSSSLRQRIDPVCVELAWNRLSRPGASEQFAELLMDYDSNFKQYGATQEYFRRASPRALLLWGINDQYLTAEAANAYMVDLPAAQLQTFDGGHWLLETHSYEVNQSIRKFLCDER